MYYYPLMRDKIKRREAPSRRGIQGMNYIHRVQRCLPGPGSLMKEVNHESVVHKTEGV